MHSSPSKASRVSIETFAWEVYNDLPKLIEEHVTGVYISHMQEYYGESAARVMKACQILQERGKVVLAQAASNAHYIIPPDYVCPVPFIELTDLQRKLVLYLHRTCRFQHTRQMRTNYSQLARIMNCSYGGLHTCTARLVDLGYLIITEPSKAGKQNQLLITLTGPLLDPHLDS